MRTRPPSAGEDRSLPKIWIRSYYKSFDGVRGLAMMLVFTAHFGDLLLGPKLSSKLWVGVELFFVLSGFLITGILYDSLNRKEFFRNFYVRRSLRIFPIFYGFFLALILLTPILHLHYENSLFAFAFYIGNFFLPFADFQRHNPALITGAVHGLAFRGGIAHFWSLCIEEQFYLTWPLVIYFVRSRKMLMRICMAGCLGIPLLRIGLAAISHWHHHIPWMAFYCLPFTRFDTLLWGSLAALWLRHQPLTTVKLRSFSVALIVLPILLMAILGRYSPWVDYTSDCMFMRTVGYTLVALASLGLVLGSLDDDFLMARCLRFRPLAYLGTMSYGFYFYHGMLVDSVRGLTPGVIPSRWAGSIPFIAFAITFALAWSSFRFLESPFLRLKSRLAPQSATSRPGELTFHVPQPQPSGLWRGTL